MARQKRTASSPISKDSKHSCVPILKNKYRSCLKMFQPCTDMFATETYSCVVIIRLHISQYFLHKQVKEVSKRFRVY